MEGSGLRLIVDNRECLIEGGPKGIAWAGRVVLRDVTVKSYGTREDEVGVGVAVSSQLDEIRLSATVVGVTGSVGDGGVVKLKLAPELELTGVDVAGELPS